MDGRHKHMIRVSWMNDCDIIHNYSWVLYSKYEDLLSRIEKSELNKTKRKKSGDMDNDTRQGTETSKCWKYIQSMNQIYEKLCDNKSAAVKSISAEGREVDDSNSRMSVVEGGYM